MLPTAEVEAKVDRDKSGNPIFKSEMAKDRYYANKNLGEAGGKQMKEVQNAINEARRKVCRRLYDASYRCCNDGNRCGRSSSFR